MHEDIESIMSEGPGGETSRVDSHDGFTFVEPSRGTQPLSGALGAGDAGMTAHRGVLKGDEYVDAETLQAAVEDALGYTYADVTAAYKNGRPTAEQRQLRDRIDARLLALSRSGGNLRILSTALGLNEKTVDRALNRARAVEVTPIVKNPAVRTRHVSFITGLPGASPKRRRHKGCPGHMLPEADRRVSYINLTDDEYARGA